MGCNTMFVCKLTNLAEGTREEGICGCRLGCQHALTKQQLASSPLQATPGNAAFHLSPLKGPVVLRPCSPVKVHALTVLVIMVLAVLQARGWTSRPSLLLSGRGSAMGDVKLTGIEQCLAAGRA